MSHAVKSWTLAFGIAMAMAVVGATAAHAEAAAEGADDPHAQHRQMMLKQAGSDLHRTEAVYETPNLKLIRDDGRTVILPTELDDGRPVFMNFIYTTCTTICPVTSQIFSMLQQKLGADRDKVHLVSISIDPEQDTPTRLRSYASRFRAGSEWQHYTGTLAASVATQRAFDVYRGDKMNHLPVTLVRAAPGRPWVRLEGFATADQLYAEYRALLATR